MTAPLTYTEQALQEAVARAYYFGRVDSIGRRGEFVDMRAFTDEVQKRDARIHEYLTIYNTLADIA